LLAYEPMKRLANLNSDLQQGLAATERVFAMIDAKPMIVEKPGAEPLVVRRGEIALRGVHFSYMPGQKALNGINLVVPAGKTVALVGPSGAGKSTILNLIPRFYDTTEGAVLIDGRDVRDVTLASLRASMGLVSQEISLFDDTVRANIAYGRPGASEAEIVEAAKNAAAHDFIVDLPNGYDTEVGGRGVKLSGGQRQRLAIARAMLKNAPILLLDEATSALDTESERQVQTALRRLMSGRTTLVIAHRLSTVVDADIIYVIDSGQVRESGTHRELLAKGGVYAGLYATQLTDDLDHEALPTPLARGARA
jgi:subfamily B ATP-binding cassette protein MsbA